MLLFYHHQQQAWLKRDVAIRVNLKYLTGFTVATGPNSNFKFAVRNNILVFQISS